MKASAMLMVTTPDTGHMTVADVQAWVDTVSTLGIPASTVLDECLLSLCFSSDVVGPIYGESDLGVEGTDVLVGMPR